MLCLCLGGMQGGPPRRGAPAPPAAAYGYEPYPDQVDPYDPYRRMPQPAAAAENYSLGPMPRGPRPQVTLLYESDSYCMIVAGLVFSISDVV